MKNFSQVFDSQNNCFTSRNNNRNNMLLKSSSDVYLYKINLNKKQLNFKKNFKNFFGKTKEGFSKFPLCTIPRKEEDKKEDKISELNESVHDEENNENNSNENIFDPKTTINFNNTEINNEIKEIYSITNYKNNVPTKEKKKKIFRDIKNSKKEKNAELEKDNNEESSEKNENEITKIFKEKEKKKISDMEEEEKSESFPDYEDDKNNKELEEDNVNLKTSLKSEDYKNNNNNEPIDELFDDLSKKGLTNGITDIYDNNRKLVGRRILKSNKNLTLSQKNWIKTYHGTKFEYIESLFENGLKKPGEIFNNNQKVKPRKGHIKFEKTIYKIKDWAKAIFVSPSIFYSSCSCFSEKINSNCENWRVVLEVKIKPESYGYYDSTISNYHFIKDEPNKIEYRIEKEKDVYIYSILFVEDNFIKNAKKYQEGDIFD